MPRARVLLADDHRVLLAGLKELLTGEYDLVGTVVDGNGLVAAAAKLRPDVAVVDIAMPGMNGIDAMRRIRATFPGIKFVILSVHSDAAYVEEALRAGAQGYVLKQAAAEELFTALRAVMAGRTYVTSMAEYTRHGAKPRERLTLRQIDVLRMTAEGLHNKEIAQRLSISVKTVEYHKTRLMNQLDIHTTIGLTRYAIRRGIAQP